MTTNHEPIHVPPVDPEKIALALQEQAESVKEQLNRLEEAKRVSQETMRRVVNI